MIYGSVDSKICSCNYSVNHGKTKYIFKYNVNRKLVLSVIAFLILGAKLLKWVKAIAIWMHQNLPWETAVVCWNETICKMHIRSKGTWTWPSAYLLFQFHTSQLHILGSRRFCLFQVQKSMQIQLLSQQETPSASWFSRTCSHQHFGKMMSNI